MKAALGLPTPALPDVLPAARVAANYIIPLRGDGRFNGFSGLEKVAEHPETARIVTFSRQGIFHHPPAFGGYPGFIFSVHASDEAASAYHQWLDASLSINWNQ